MSADFEILNLNYDEIFWKWFFELEFCREAFEESERSLQNIVVQELLRFDYKVKKILDNENDPYVRQEEYWMNRAERTDLEEHLKRCHTRYFRNNFLISICSIFESGVTHSIKCINGNNCNKPRQKSWPKYAADIFVQNLGINIFDDEDLEKLNDAFFIRNFIAHDNSDISKLNDKRRKKNGWDLR